MNNRQSFQPQFGIGFRKIYKLLMKYMLLNTRKLSVAIDKTLVPTNVFASPCPAFVCGTGLLIEQLLSSVCRPWIVGLTDS